MILFHLLIILIIFSNILLSRYIILIYKLGEMTTILITDSKNWRMNMKSEKKERNCRLFAFFLKRRKFNFEETRENGDSS